MFLALIYPCQGFLQILMHVGAAQQVCKSLRLRRRAYVVECFRVANTHFSQVEDTSALPCTNTICEFGARGLTAALFGPKLSTDT
jgi:hypothetical protein